MSFKQEINFTLNGAPTTVSIPAHMDTLTMLRDVLQLTGTKLGCGEGECGACTILVDDVATNACIMFAVDCDGREITTIEGLSDNGDHPLQRAWLEENVSQCGYCQPGQILTAVALLAVNPDPSDEEIVDAMKGNLCRCGSYQRIRNAIRTAF